MPTHFQGPHDQVLALDTFIKLSRASLTLNHVVQNQIRAVGLTEPQFAVLEVLYHRGPLRQGLISQKLLFSGGNLTMVLDHLERDGLILRKPNPEDRRCTIVHLTDGGNKLIQDYFPQHAEFIQNLMSPLTEDELQTLGRLTRKLGRSVFGESQSNSE